MYLENGNWVNLHAVIFGKDNYLQQIVFLLIKTRKSEVLAPQCFINEMFFCSVMRLAVDDNFALCSAHKFADRQESLFPPFLCLSVKFRIEAYRLFTLKINSIPVFLSIYYTLCYLVLKIVICREQNNR